MNWGNSCCSRERGGSWLRLWAMQGSDPTLSGKKVWVTRPAHQAAELCRMIKERGGAPLKLPTLVIRPCPRMKTG